MWPRSPAYVGFHGVCDDNHVSLGFTCMMGMICNRWNKGLMGLIMHLPPK